MFSDIVQCLVLGGLLFCGVAGCSPVAGGGQADIAESQKLTGDLGRMQGRWESISSGKVFSCEADVKNCRVQLRYRHVEDGPLIRTGRVFDRVDEQRKCFVIDGAVEWSYTLDQLDGRDFLKLEFLCNDCNAWHTVLLHRGQDV